RQVAEDVDVWRRAVDQAERDARVGRVEDRALPLDPEQLTAAGDALEDEPLRRAGDEVRDDRVDREPPAGDRHAGLPRRDELARETAAPRLRIELERDRHLPDRAVRAD